MTMRAVGFIHNFSLQQVHQVNTMELWSSSAYNERQSPWACTQRGLLMQVWEGMIKTMVKRGQKQTICSGVNKKKKKKTKVFTSVEMSMASGDAWNQLIRLLEMELRPRRHIKRKVRLNQSMLAFHFRSCYVKCLCCPSLSLHPPHPPPPLRFCTLPLRPPPPPSRGRWADPPGEESGPSWGCWTLNCHCCCASAHLKTCQKERKKERERWAWRSQGQS